MEIIGPMIIASWKDSPPIIFMTVFDECCLNSFKAKKAPRDAKPKYSPNIRHISKSSFIYQGI